MGKSAKLVPDIVEKRYYVIFCRLNSYIPIFPFCTSAADRKVKKGVHFSHTDSPPFFHTFWDTFFFSLGDSSPMHGIPDSPLGDITREIVRRAEPQEERMDLERLLVSILLYIKRVRGGGLTAEERGYPAHRSFDFLALPPSNYLVEALERRLGIIRDYNIRSIPRIEEILLYGLKRETQAPLTPNQVEVLKQLCEEPRLTTAELVQRLGLSRYTIKKVLRQLRDDFGLRTGYVINFGKLKLSTHSLVFRTKSLEASRDLESWVRRSNLPFLKTLVFDANHRDGHMAFTIPSQQRALQAFERRAEWIRRTFMEQVQLHHCLGILCNTRFDDYDARLGRWRIPEELIQAGLHKYLTIHRNDPKYTHFQVEATFGRPVSFTQVDFIIAYAQFKGAWSLAEKHELLKDLGFTLSPKTVWSRLQRLHKMGVVIPYTYFSGGLFQEFVCLSFLCNSKAREQLRVLSSRLPFTITYITDQGIVIFLKCPQGWGDFLTRLTREATQLPGVSDLMVVRQDRNVGSSLGIDLFSRWNEKRQFWEFKDQEI